MSIPEVRQEPLFGPHRALGSSPRPLASEGLGPCAPLVAAPAAAKQQLCAGGAVLYTHIPRFQPLASNNF